jgi:hypothetical protein
MKNMRPSDRTPSLVQIVDLVSTAKCMLTSYCRECRKPMNGLGFSRVQPEVMNDREYTLCATQAHPEAPAG